MFGFAGEYRADHNLFDTCSLDSLASCLTNLFAGLYDEVTVIIQNIMYGHTTEDTLRQCCHYAVTLFDSVCTESTERTAVLFVHNHIMRYIDETTCQITGIGRLQSGIGKTLTSTVSRDEVLEHGHSLFEVREDRVLNLRTRIGSTGLQRLCHDTTDTCQLLDLLIVTTGTGVHHHVNRVESAIRFRHMLHQDLLEVLVDLLPCIDRCAITLVIGHSTKAITLIDDIDFRITFLGQLFLLLRDNNIIEVEAQTTLESAVVTEVFDIIEELCCASYTAGLDDLRDDALHGTLLHQFVLESDLCRYILVHDNTTRSGLNQLTIHTHFDFRVNIYATFVQRDDSLFFGIEDESLALYACAFLSDII